MPEPAGRRLVLLRHGQTEWNALGRAQGQADVELDDTGHAQAVAVAPHVAALRPSALWSSDLARARQTAAYVEKETDLVAILDPRLREFSVGERTGLTMAEFAEQFPDEHAQWRTGRYDVISGAESTADVAARILPACHELLASIEPGQTAVAVTHGAALRVAVVELLGWDPDAADSLRAVANCGVAVLESTTPEASLRLVAYNLAPDFTSVLGGS